VIAPLQKMKGVGLIELMISMTIGLVTVGVIGWVYLGSIQTYRTHDAISRLQEGARYAFEIISRDLRMAGVTGCSMDTSSNVINGGTEWYMNLFTMPVHSEDKNPSAASGALNKFSDALSVLRADVSREYIVANPAAPNFTLKTAANPAIPNGEFMVATDCKHAAVFQSTGNAGVIVGHDIGGGPGNTTTDLGPAGGGYVFTPGARLYRLSAVTYYVAPNAAGVPSLFRRTMVAGAAQDEELVEGVEDLRLHYAVDTSSPPDGQADFVAPYPYLSGDDVSNEITLGSDEEARWSRVVSVRVSLLMRTAEDRVIPQPQTYTFDGVSTTPDDRHLRKVFTHVVKLRNR
jgi:type IV pilus assembly protein PilW